MGDFCNPLQAAILACFKVLGKRTITFYFRTLVFGGFVSRSDPPKKKHEEIIRKQHLQQRLAGSADLMKLLISIHDHPTNPLSKRNKESLTHPLLYFAIPSPYLFVELMRTCPFLTIMSCPWLKKERNEPRNEPSARTGGNKETPLSGESCYCS